VNQTGITASSNQQNPTKTSRLLWKCVGTPFPGNYIDRDPWRATFTNGAYLATSQTSPWKKATKCETNTFALKHCCVYYNPHITG